MMKTSNFLFFATLLLAIALSLQTLAQVNVIPVAKDTEATKYEGLYYALPKTLVRVDVMVDRIETLRGPFAEYAARLLSLDNVPRVNSVRYNLAAINLSTVHEIDPDHFYFVRIPKKHAGGLQFSLSPEGFIHGATVEEQAKSRKKADISSGLSDMGFRGQFVDLAIPNIIERVDTFIRRISVDTTTFEEVFFRRTFIEKTTEQRAREAANFILKLEDHRLSLITGYQEVNYSAEVMQFMSDQLRELQEEYLALFKGKTTVTSSQYTFYFEPKSGQEQKPVTLFRFSAQRGVVEKDYPVGEAVQIQFSNSGSTARMASHQALRERGRRKHFGFFYRFPETASINLIMGDESLAESQFLFSQLGVVSFLPAEKVNEIQFHSETGSVKHFRLK